MTCLQYLKGHNSETEKCGTIIRVWEKGLDLIYFSIKHYEDILKIVYGRIDFFV